MIITQQMIEAPTIANKDLWGTPWKLFYRAQSVLNISFTLDPCAVKETAKCPKWFSPQIDGLSQDWCGHTVFCNPPYSRGNIDIWVNECYRRSYQANIVALLPVSTSADWFQKYCIGQSLYFVDKRVRFENAPHTAPFSSVFVHFNHKSTTSGFKQ